MPIYERRKPQQEDKRRLPGGIKEVACYQQADLFATPFDGGIVHHEHYQEKDDKRQRVKQHFVFNVIGVGASR